MKRIAPNKMFDEENLNSRIEIQERSLQNYAKEIYENIGQVLSLAKILLLSLNTEGSKNVAAIGDSGKLLGKAITDLRSLAKQLTPEQVVKKGFAAAFISELERLNSAGFCKAIYSVDDRNSGREEVKELVIFCILQQIIHPALNINSPGFINLKIRNKRKVTAIEIETGFDEESLLLNIDEMAVISERLKAIGGKINYKKGDKKILRIIINT
jgi:signal transduction histidine kinase